MANYKLIIGASGLTLPSWRPSEGTSATYTVGDGVLVNSFASQISDYYEDFWSIKSVNDYSSGIFNPYYGTYGAVVYAADGGHASTNFNGVIVKELLQDTIQFVKLAEGTPYFGTGTDSTTKQKNAYDLAFPATSLCDSDYGDPLVSVDTRKVAPASHSYTMNKILPPSMGGAAYGTWIRIGHKYWLVANSSNIGGAHKFDINSKTVLASNEWSRVISTPIDPADLGASGCGYSVISQTHKKIYNFFRSNTQPPMIWDSDTETVTFGTGTPFQFGDSTDSNNGVVLEIPERSLYVAMYRVSGSLVVQWMDASSADPTLGGTATLSAALPVESPGPSDGGEGWCHACWCPDNSRIIVGGILYSGSNDTDAYYEIEIPTTLSDTWTVTRRVVTNGIPWSIGTFGTWQRPHYSQAARCVVYFPKAHYSGGGTDAVTVFTPYGVT